MQDILTYNLARQPECNGFGYSGYAPALFSTIRFDLNRATQSPEAFALRRRLLDIQVFGGCRDC